MKEIKKSGKKLEQMIEEVNGCIPEIAKETFNKLRDTLTVKYYNV